MRYACSLTVLHVSPFCPNAGACSGLEGTAPLCAGGAKGGCDISQAARVCISAGLCINVDLSLMQMMDTKLVLLCPPSLHNELLSWCCRQACCDAASASGRDWRTFLLVALRKGCKSLPGLYRQSCSLTRTALVWERESPSSAGSCVSFEHLGRSHEPKERGRLLATCSTPLTAFWLLPVGMWYWMHPNLYTIISCVVSIGLDCTAI